MHLTDTFIQSNVQCIQDKNFFVSMCVPWELNPQPFALLTQCIHLMSLYCIPAAAIIRPILNVYVLSSLSAPSRSGGAVKKYCSFKYLPAFQK